MDTVKTNTKTYRSITAKTLFWIFFLALIMLVFIGCEKQESRVDRPQQLKCMDNHLYSIIKNTRYELIEENGCVKGSIELKDK
jgi:hypothetical protein